MPRTAAEALLTQPIGPQAPRLDPLDTLTPRQAEVWRAVVAALPPDYFNTAQTRQLGAYCVAVCQREDVSRELEREQAKRKPRRAEVAELRRELGDWMERENRFARSLRLTHQAVYHPETAGTKTRKGQASAADLMREMNEDAAFGHAED